MTTLGLRGVTLLISGRCNLSCAYCYQGPRRCGERLAWQDAKAALDLLFQHGTPPLSVEFSGGEPLREWDLLLRCLRHAEKRGGGPPARLVLTTNGQLLSASRLRVLARHGVAIQVSFDGLPEAQRRRGGDTFARLDRLLREAAVRHPGHFRSRFRVQSIVNPGTLRHLARSVRYFLSRGVWDIVLAPAFGGSGAVSEASVARLDEQIGQVLDASLDLWRSEKRIPVAFLRPACAFGEETPGDYLCSAGCGKGIAVDPDGRVWTCPLFAPSLQDLGPLLREASRAMDLGAIRDSALVGRLTALTERTGRVPLLTRREEKYSHLGRCRECEFLQECRVCPGAIGHAPGNRDPHRVPDFQCAWSRATLRARRDFLRSAAGA